MLAALYRLGDGLAGATKRLKKPFIMYGKTAGPLFAEIRRFCRLKWLNSPYRPALPEGIRAGCRPAASGPAGGA